MTANTSLITGKPPAFLHDFPAMIQEDPQFKSKIQQRMDDIRVQTQGMDRLAQVKAMAALIPEAGWNFGHLVPMFFPRYPVDKPLDLRTRPFMYAMTCLAAGSTTTLMAGRQVGKCVTGDTAVETRQGRVTLEQLFDAGR